MLLTPCFRVPARHGPRDAIAGCRWIRLPRKHFVGYVSHKGDRGHDSAEPVSSEGEGAQGCQPKASECLLATCRLGSQERALQPSWRGKEGEGASSSPGEHINPTAKPYGPSRAPAGGLQSGRWGPLSWLHITRQTEILHFQAVENVKFPCSRLESHQHRAGTLVIVADQASDWQLGMSLINFFKRNRNNH